MIQLGALLAAKDFQFMKSNPVTPFGLNFNGGNVIEFEATEGGDGF